MSPPQAERRSDEGAEKRSGAEGVKALRARKPGREAQQ